MEAYNHCHDPNGIYGVIDRNDRVSAEGMLYEHERRYEFALRVHSIRGSVPGTSRVLNAMGCHNLLRSYLDTAYPVDTTYGGTDSNANSNSVENEQLEMYHEACWRVSRWDTLHQLNGVNNVHNNLNDGNYGNHQMHKMHTKYGQKSIGFHGSIFNALSALKQKDDDAFHDAVFQGKLNLIRRPFTKRESIQPLYGSMVKWAMFNSIETAWNALKDPTHIPSQGTNPLFDLSTTYRGKHFFESLHPQNSVLTADSSMMDDVLFSSFDFDFLEPLWSLHSTLFSILPNRLENKTVQVSPPKDSQHKGKVDRFKKQCPPILSHFYGFAQMARNANRLSVAHQILQCAKRLIVPKDPKIEVDLRFDEGLLMEHALKLEEGRYLWAEGACSINKGHLSRALQKALSVMNAMPSSIYKSAEKSYENQHLRAASHCDIGEWLMASHLRDPERTMEILTKGENLSKNLNTTGKKRMSKYRLMFDHSYCRSSYLLAKFSDGIYQNLESRFSSQEWRQFDRRLKLQKKQIESLNATIKETQNEITKLSKRRRRSKDHEAAMFTAKQRLKDQMIFKNRLQKDYDYDHERGENVKSQREEALKTSITHYCSALVVDSKYDLYILYRLISLWFDNATSNHRPTRIISRYFDGSNSSQISTSKLIPLVYQIASRLSLPTKTENVDPLDLDQMRQQNPWCDVEEQKRWNECRRHDDGDDEEEEKRKKERRKQIATNFFHSVIYLLIRKMASHHPHHCLYQIFQLCNVDKANESARIKTGYQINESKKCAASTLIQQLKTMSDLEPIVNGIESLIDAYCSISGASSREAKQRRHGQKVTFPVANYPKMLRILNVEQLPIATVALHPNDDIERIPFISRYKEEAALAASGITCPVIVDVLGSNGKEYRELVKPQDDLRQDAVMEQVFCLVNKVLLDHNKSNQHIVRKRIRTYKVVPLTPTIGIVQWVKGTMPIGMYLNRAHTKYQRKGDYSPNEARSKMANTAKMVQQQTGSKLQRNKSLQSNRCLQNEENQRKNKKDRLRKQFDDICKHFPPVFHKFFFEEFCHFNLSSSAAERWFAARLSYIISCAINCIIGYLLGLGDRHTQNILIDVGSAELIHIDLGVAFDQGKLLRTPECVPFRLTRDIVDGFGLNSVDGTFKQICIEVLKLMRENQQIFYTVLRVFVHDPLYKWSLDPDKMNRLQGRGESENERRREREQKWMEMNEEERAEEGSSSATSNNEQAQRALHILRQKFQGSDNTQMNAISVEGQVNRLIRDARDRNNLCQMFHGWASWM